MELLLEAVTHMSREVIAFDVGGTALKMGRVGPDGTLRQAMTVPIHKSDGKQIQAEMLKYLEAQEDSFVGVAISAPGFVNAETGYIEMGGAIREFDHFNLKEWLENEIHLPVSIENDANSALLAEKWLGKAKDLDNFLVLTIGTGIGGGIYINGKLLSGKNNAAGEFGYMLVKRVEDETQPENYTMNTNSTMAVLCRNYAKEKGLGDKKVTGIEVFAAYDAKEPIALAVVHDLYRNLAMGIFNLVYIFDPTKIFIGGGITARATFMNELKAELSLFSVDPDILDSVHFKNDAGMIGATYHFLLQNNLL